MSMLLDKLKFQKLKFNFLFLFLELLSHNHTTSNFNLILGGYGSRFKKQTSKNPLKWIFIGGNGQSDSIKDTNDPGPNKKNTNTQLTQTGNSKSKSSFSHTNKSQSKQSQNSNCNQQQQHQQNLVLQQQKKSQSIIHRGRRTVRIFGLRTDMSPCQFTCCVAFGTIIGVANYHLCHDLLDFGNWYTYENGDVLNCLTKYPIEHCHSRGLRSKFYDLRWNSKGQQGQSVSESSCNVCEQYGFRSTLYENQFLNSLFFPAPAPSPSLSTLGDTKQNLKDHKKSQTTVTKYFTYNPSDINPMMLKPLHNVKPNQNFKIVDKDKLINEFSNDEKTKQTQYVQGQNYMPGYQGPSLPGLGSSPTVQVENNNYDYSTLFTDNSNDPNSEKEYSIRQQLAELTTIIPVSRVVAHVTDSEIKQLVSVEDTFVWDPLRIMHLEIGNSYFNSDRKTSDSIEDVVNKNLQQSQSSKSKFKTSQIPTSSITSNSDFYTYHTGSAYYSSLSHNSIQSINDYKLLDDLQKQPFEINEDLYSNPSVEEFIDTVKKQVMMLADKVEESFKNEIGKDNNVLKSESEGKEKKSNGKASKTTESQTRKERLSLSKAKTMNSKKIEDNIKLSQKYRNSKESIPDSESVGSLLGKKVPYIKSSNGKKVVKLSSFDKEFIKRDDFNDMPTSDELDEVIKLLEKTKISDPKDKNNLNFKRNSTDSTSNSNSDQLSTVKLIDIIQDIAEFSDSDFQAVQKLLRNNGIANSIVNYNASDSDILSNLNPENFTNVTVIDITQDIEKQLQSSTCIKDCTALHLVDTVSGLECSLNNLQCSLKKIGNVINETTQRMDTIESNSNIGTMSDSTLSNSVLSEALSHYEAESETLAAANSKTLQIRNELGKLQEDIDRVKMKVKKEQRTNSLDDKFKDSESQSEDINSKNDHKSSISKYSEVHFQKLAPNTNCTKHQFHCYLFIKLGNLINAVEVIDEFLNNFQNPPNIHNDAMSRLDGLQLNQLFSIIELLTDYFSFKNAEFQMGVSKRTQLYRDQLMKSAGSASSEKLKEFQNKLKGFQSTQNQIKEKLEKNWGITLVENKEFSIESLMSSGSLANLVRLRKVEWGKVTNGGSGSGNSKDKSGRSGKKGTSSVYGTL